ncbi:ABC transporter permease, partial [Bacillaceae bacterium Marseille-Q3522]|nr:ABC transporter permease [Bacillaceae bacterium Marseille-Q3522]
MKILSIVYMAIKAIFKQNIKQTVLSIVGVVIGIAAVITVVSIGRSFEKYTIENLTGQNEMGIRIVINFYPENEELFSSNFQLFNEQDKKLLSNLDGIDQVSLKETNSNI